MTGRDLVRRLVEELAAVLAATIGGEPAINADPGGETSVWALRFASSGVVKGDLTLGVPQEDAARLACLVTGAEAPPPDDLLVDSLQEMTQQAASALSVKYAPSLKVILATPAAVTDVPDGTEWAVITLGGQRTRLAVWHSLAVEMPEALPEIEDDTAGLVLPPPPPIPVASGLPANLDLILDIDLPLWVRFGETSMTLQALTRLGPGTTLDLERSPDDPVDVMVNNTVIARGEVVVVAGNYGVRVTEVMSTTDRIRSMAG